MFKLKIHKSPGKQVKNRMKRSGWREVVIWLVLLFVLVPWVTSQISNQGKQPIAFSQLLTDAQAGQVKQIEVEGDKLIARYQDESVKVAYKESDSSLTKILLDQGVDLSQVEIKVKDTSWSQIWADLLSSLLFLGLMIAAFWFLFRQAKGAQENIFSFGRSRAKLFDKGKPTVKFSDVAGVDEAKKELEEVVDFLKHPKKYQRLGARTPKGVLLVGPSGVGKTLLARAVAGEANVPFYSMAGSEFMEMLVGVGASRVRDLFATAKKNAPAIIFIDEIDAIGRQRGTTMSPSGHDEREQTLNQILVEMDGFTPNDNVIVLAATNRGDLLDPALLRPGRFDRRITLDLPDVEGREAILKIHARGKPIARQVDWKVVARRTVGFSGADLENMLNEAAILAARDNRKQISPADIEEAALKVKLGPEKRRLQSEEEKRMTAYHEAGHAVVSYFLPLIDPVHRVSIVSRGPALGFTLISPDSDRVQETKSRLLQMISMMLAGRAAEEIFFQELTGGASSDLDKATRIARSMVMVYGMSDLGPVYWGPQIDASSLTSGWYPPVQLSDETRAKVDEEVEKLLHTAYQQAVDVIKKNKTVVKRVAEALLKKETLESEEFVKLIGKPRPKHKPRSLRAKS